MFWKANRLNSIVNSVVNSTLIKNSVKKILSVWSHEQYHHLRLPLDGYINLALNTSIYRYNFTPPGGLCCDGFGSPVTYTGMIWSGFRPSDDSCEYGYFIPGNMFASSTLKYIEEISLSLWKDKSIYQKATILRNQIDDGIQKYAIYNHQSYGKIYVFEVDGLGTKLLIDDANSPSLLSIPYLGWNYDESIYSNTRRFILSKDNPFYKVSNDGKLKGIGSLHNQKTILDNVWPLALSLQGLTTTDIDEKIDLLTQLIKTSNTETKCIHESFDVNYPTTYTRSWFAWANTMFCELVASLIPYTIEELINSMKYSQSFPSCG